MLSRDEVPKAEDPNGPPRWQGENVCKKFLVKFCPNDLFVNTKSDLGKQIRLHVAPPLCLSMLKLFCEPGVKFIGSCMQ